LLVPIYDGHGRDAFDFLLSDFSHITLLPCWDGAATQELPPWAMVSVGYTANMYKYTVGGEATDQNSLSLNVMFVVLHGFMD